LGIAGQELDAFVSATAEALTSQPAGVMLNQGVANAYQQGADKLGQQSGVECVIAGAEPGAQGYCGQARLYRVAAKDFLANPALQEEVFGPTSLVVVCDNATQLTDVAGALSGQLTGTLHGTEAELGQHSDLVRVLEQRVGRLVFNGFPTGVEVCEAMMHGGPHPASSDTRFTSVGTAAIDRWLRPVCYQNSPASLLPPALQNANPWQLRRRVDGQWQTGPL